jgi:hypothetical protein
VVTEKAGLKDLKKLKEKVNMKKLLILLVVCGLIGCNLSSENTDTVNSWDVSNIKNLNNAQDDTFSLESDVYTRLEGMTGILGQWERTVKGETYFGWYYGPYEYDAYVYMYTFKDDGTYIYSLVNHVKSGNGFQPITVTYDKGTYILEKTSNEEYSVNLMKDEYTSNEYTYKASDNYLKLYEKIAGGF